MLEHSHWIITKLIVQLFVLVLLVAMEMGDRTLYLQQMLIFKLAQWKKFVSDLNFAHFSSGSIFCGPAGNTLVILESQYAAVGRAHLRPVLDLPSSFRDDGRRL